MRTIACLLLAVAAFSASRTEPVTAQTARQAERLPVEIVPRTGHSREIEAIAVTRDGRFLASGSDSGSVKLWDIETTREIRTFYGLKKRVDGLALSPDGAILFAADNDSVQVWEVRSGRLLRAIKADRGIDSITLSPDGRVLAAADGDVKLWDAASGRELFSLKTRRTVKQVAFSPDSRTLAFGTREDAVQLWDVGTGKLLRSEPTRQDTMSIAFSPDGRSIVTGDSDKTVTIRDTGTLRVVRSFAGHEKAQWGSQVRTVAFSPDGRTFATGGEDGDVKVWDSGTGQRKWSVSVHARVNALVFSPDGRAIFATGRAAPLTAENIVAMLDVATGERTRAFRSHTYEVHSLSLAPGGQTIAASSRVGTGLWDITSGRAMYAHKLKHLLATSHVSYTADGRGLVSASFDALKLSDAETGTEIRSYLGQDGTLRIVAVSPDGRWLASGYKTLTIWDLASGKALRTLNNPKAGQIKSLTFSPDSRILAVANEEKSTVTLLDVATGRPLRVLSGHTSWVWDMAFTADGRTLATASWDNSIRLWTVANGANVRTLAGHTDNINKAAFSPDGQLLVSASSDSTLKLWDPASGREHRTVSAPIGHVRDLKFLPGGRIFVTASDDGTIRYWSIEGQLVATSIPGNGWITITPEGFFATSVPTLTPERRSWLGVQLAQDFTGRGARVDAVVDGSPARAAGMQPGDILLRVHTTTVQAAADVVRTTAATPPGTEIDVVLIRSGRNESLRVRLESPGDLQRSGANELLSVVRGLDIYSINQLYQSLYRPDLVREKLAGDPRGLVREAAERLDLSKVVDSGYAPLVRFASPANGAQASGSRVTAEIDIEVRSGGIGRIEWRLNGLTVGVDADPAAPAGSNQPLRVSRELALDAGTNEIEVTVYNSANLVASTPARVRLTAAPVQAAPAQPQTPGQAPGPPAPPTQRLFVLAAGLNDYADPRFRLNNAVPDANALGKAFQDTSKGVYADVDVTILRDDEVTREKLDAAFGELAAKAQPGDAFVFFLAGHGKTVDGRYYFAPRDFKLGADRSDAAVNAAMREQGIAQEQWQRWFASVPARRSVILLDTCEAGTIVNDDTQTLERGAASDRLAQATGRSIITASSGDSEAIEGYRGHGLFTYTLLDALGRGDGDGNGTIELTELAAYAHAQVTALSEKVFRQRQVPQMKITSNHAIARQLRVLPDAAPDIAISARPTHQTVTTASLMVLPSNGSQVVRSLNANTPLTLVRTEAGWTLVAREGKPVGYIAARALAPIR